jgi:hypothetical protein
MKCDCCANWQQQQVQLKLQRHSEGLGLTEVPVDDGSVVRQSVSGTRQKSYFLTGCVSTMEIGMTMEGVGGVRLMYISSSCREFCTH